VYHVILTNNSTVLFVYSDWQKTMRSYWCWTQYWCLLAVQLQLVCRQLLLSRQCSRVKVSDIGRHLNDWRRKTVSERLTRQCDLNSETVLFLIFCFKFWFWRILLGPLEWMLTTLYFYTQG
jgi:hypothetical protein